jgi:hypothetical protein
MFNKIGSVIGLTKTDLLLVLLSCATITALYLIFVG